MLNLDNKVEGLGYVEKQGFYLHQCLQKFLSQRSYWMEGGLYFVMKGLTGRGQWIGFTWVCFMLIYCQAIDYIYNLERHSKVPNKYSCTSYQYILRNRDQTDNDERWWIQKNVGNWISPFSTLCPLHKAWTVFSDVLRIINYSCKRRFKSFYTWQEEAVQSAQINISELQQVAFKLHKGEASNFNKLNCWYKKSPSYFFIKSLQNFCNFQLPLCISSGQNRVCDWEIAQHVKFYRKTLIYSKAPHTPPLKGRNITILSPLTGMCVGYWFLMDKPCCSTSDAQWELVNPNGQYANAIWH